MGLFYIQLFLLFMLAAHIDVNEQCYIGKKVDQMNLCLLQAALFSATEHCKALPSEDLSKIAEQQLVPTVVVVDSQSYGAVGRPPVPSYWRSKACYTAEQLCKNVAQHGQMGDAIQTGGKGRLYLRNWV